MSHTNVSVPELNDKHWEYYEQKQMYETRIKILSERLSALVFEFKNIPEAIEKYGYIDLTYDKETIRLVKDPKEIGRQNRNSDNLSEDLDEVLKDLPE